MGGRGLAERRDSCSTGVVLGIWEVHKTEGWRRTIHFRYAEDKDIRSGNRLVAAIEEGTPQAVPLLEEKGIGVLYVGGTATRSKWIREEAVYRGVNSRTAREGK